MGVGESSEKAAGVEKELKKRYWYYLYGAEVIEN